MKTENSLKKRRESVFCHFKTNGTFPERKEGKERGRREKKFRREEVNNESENGKFWEALKEFSSSTRLIMKFVSTCIVKFFCRLNNFAKTPEIWYRKPRSLILKTREKGKRGKGNNLKTINTRKKKRLIPSYLYFYFFV